MKPIPALQPVHVSHLTDRPKGHCATSWIYDSVYSAYMLNIHMNIHMLYAKNTHWYILRIEPESHVVYFAYTRYYHVRLLWVC